MERSQLEYFLAIVDAGRFTAAAEVVGLTQPSLSSAMKSLERELGVQLFHRLPRGVKLTSAGEELAESARRILNEFELARVRAQSIEDVVIGTLELVALPGLLLEPLAGLIGRFRNQHPGVFVRVQHAEQIAEVHRAVAAGKAELGMSDKGGAGDQQLRSHLVSRQELVAVVPNCLEAAGWETVTLEALLDMAVVTGPPGTDARDLLDEEARRLGRHFRPAVEVGQRGAGLYFVAAGAGLSILPRPFAELGKVYGAALISIEPKHYRTAYLIHREGPLSPAARALLRVALSEVARLPAGDGAVIDPPNR